MIQLNSTIIIMFVLYLGVMLGIGLFFYFRTKNLSDYVLGGRTLNGWVTSISAQASDMSGWLLMGLPGYAYIAGLEAIWIALGLAIGTYFNWKLVAKPLRIYTQVAGDSITIPDYFENRFLDNSKILRMISAVFILVFFLFYTASGFVAGGKLFSSIFGLNYTTAVTIGVLVIVGYTFLGGFLAVCWTDLIQGTMMFFAIVIVPIIGFYTLGGVGETMTALKDLNPELLNPFKDMDGNTLSFMAIISLAAWGLGYFGQPHILVRFMGIRSAQEIKKSRKIAMIWVAFSLTAAVIVGLIGILYVKPELTGPANETVFIVMANQMFPPIVAGLLLAAVLAAIMSTADSQLLVTASAVTEDFYKVLLRKNASQKELVVISRCAVIAIAIIAYWLALDGSASILGIVAYAWAGLGATFGPAILLSLFWKRMTRNGALAGMIAGGVTVIIWKQLTGGIFDLYEIVPAFILSIVAIVVVSLLDKEPEKAIQETFEVVRAERLK